MKATVIIQARMGSTRLPGKIMKKLEGRTVLEHDIIRVRTARRVEQVVVATSDLAADDPVAAEALRAGAAVTRGSEQDVLARYRQAAVEHGAELIVRVTSDCPLLDPALLDEMLAEVQAAAAAGRPYDYYSNTLGRRTFPTGLDLEIFTRQALERAFREARRPHEREHVTPYFYQNPGLFHLGGMTAPEDNSRHRWTLDTPADLEFIRRVYDALYREDRLFTTADVLRLLAEQPEIMAINSAVQAKTMAPGRTGGLLIRADASPLIGSGHLLRCLALAQAWPPENGPVVFALAEGDELYGDRLRGEGFLVEGVPGPVAGRADAAATAALMRSHEPDWVVVDGYRFDDTYLAELLPEPGRILLLDDSGRRRLLPVAAVLNQNLHAAADLYPDRDPWTRLLLGVEYALLRREFGDAAMVAPETPAVARRILVTLGGGDPDNVTGKVLDGLAALPETDLAVRILVGETSPHLGDLRRRAEACPFPVEILTGVADMVAQYRWAQLAVTGAGSTLWELACLGVPAVTLILADNQEPSGRLLDRQGIVLGLGRHQEAGPRDIAAAVAGLLEDPDRRAAMSRAGRALVDGRGARRVAGFLGETMGKEKNP